jgi:chorismate dehydratase
MNRYNRRAMQDPALTTLGVVSFLNSRPLIEGLDATRGVSLHYAVPSALPAMLRRGEVDAALIPVVDLARHADRWERVSDACIASDGETLTVRVFSKTPPEQMNALFVDPDSHTSVALAQLIWSYHFERRLVFQPLAAVDDLNDCEAVLLIGDKVVNAPMNGFEYEVDLGGAWQAWQGLPFVFAVWAANRVTGYVGRALPANPPVGGRSAEVGGQCPPYLALPDLLESARDRGVARAREIAREIGPSHGWPVELAQDYLLRRLSFTLTPRHLKGMQRFIELATEEGIISNRTELVR